MKYPGLNGPQLLLFTFFGETRAASNFLYTTVANHYARIGLVLSCENTETFCHFCCGFPLRSHQLLFCSSLDKHRILRFGGAFQYDVEIVALSFLGYCSSFLHCIRSNESLSLIPVRNVLVEYRYEVGRIGSK